MPGRLARGEVWEWERLSLLLSVRVGGRLLLRERLDQSGVSLRELARLSGHASGACFANLVVFGAAFVDGVPWRTEIGALHREGTWVGVSPLRLLPGAWSVKIVAPDSIALRSAYAHLRAALSAVEPRMGVPMRKQ